MAELFFNQIRLIFAYRNFYTGQALYEEGWGKLSSQPFESWTKSQTRG
jgi:hypothetical protein